MLIFFIICIMNVEHHAIISHFTAMCGCDCRFCVCTEFIWAWQMLQCVYIIQKFKCGSSRNGFKCSIYSQMKKRRSIQSSSEASPLMSPVRCLDRFETLSCALRSSWELRNILALNSDHLLKVLNASGKIITPEIWGVKMFYIVQLWTSEGPSQEFTDIMMSAESDACKIKIWLKWQDAVIINGIDLCVSALFLWYLTGQKCHFITKHF